MKRRLFVIYGPNNVAGAKIGAVQTRVGKAGTVTSGVATYWGFAGNGTWAGPQNPPDLTTTLRGAGSPMVGKIASVQSGVAVGNITAIPFVTGNLADSDDPRISFVREDTGVREDMPFIDVPAFSDVADIQAQMRTGIDVLVAAAKMAQSAL